MEGLQGGSLGRKEGLQGGSLESELRAWEGSKCRWGSYLF